MGRLPGQHVSRPVDWKAWADGATWILRPGVDHDQPCRAALKSARMWALKNGMRAVAELPPTSAPFGATWRICFVPREEAPGG